MVFLSCLALGSCKKATAGHLGGDGGTDATASEPLGGGSSGGDAGTDATASEPLGGGNAGGGAGTDATAAEPLGGGNSGSGIDAAAESLGGGNWDSRVGTDATAPDSDQTPADLDAEEVAVYAALLGNAGLLVIIDQTETGVSGYPGVLPTVDSLVSKMHDVAPETTASFLARNATAYPLRADMSLGAPYVLISQAELGGLFPGGEADWGVFRARYPDAWGYQSLSRVGFNADLTQALVYLGGEVDYLAGEGDYYLMNKVNGVWTVDQTVMVWVS
jgi:hypothetical protein